MIDKIKFSNIPISEGHVITLIAGIALNWWRPLAFWQGLWQKQVIGWTLMLMGILLALWQPQLSSKWILKRRLKSLLRDLTPSPAILCTWLGL